MAMIIPVDSPYGKECWRWDHTDTETHPSDATIRGMRPSSFREYPNMGYRVTNRNPVQFAHEMAVDEHGRTVLEQRGFVFGGKQAALDAYDRQQQEFAVLAAHRNYEDRNLSERARAEVDAAEQGSSRHLPVIPEKRRGRPKKQAEPVSA